MAVNEGTRMDGQFMVISLTPDVCKSPTAPVPYPIVGYLNQSILTSPNVRMRGVPVFHMGSRVATVTGDESGVGGGVVSQVFKGMCRPVVPIPTVRINGQFHNSHQVSLMEMNCAGPNGPANTLGHVKFIGPMYNAPVAPAGKVSMCNPPLEAESSKEKSCLPGLDSLMPGGGGSGGGLGDIVKLGQTAYGLAKTDWSDPAAALGAISGVAGMAGLGGLSKAAGLGSQVAGLATADWSNPGSAIGAVMGVAGPLLGGGSGGSSGLGGALGGIGGALGGLGGGDPTETGATPGWAGGDPAGEIATGNKSGFGSPTETGATPGWAGGDPAAEISNRNNGGLSAPPGVFPGGGFVAGAPTMDIPHNSNGDPDFPEGIIACGGF